MRLNAIKSSPGSRPQKVRLGRGTGSGCGKTAGRGHKGQLSRSGGYHKVGFEGGQMPLQRRLPKVGFRSLKSRRSAEVRLHELNKFDGSVDLNALKSANLVPADASQVKVILSGTIEKAVLLKGIKATEGATKAIEAAGGKVEEV